MGTVDFFSAYTELPERFPDLVTATQAARDLPGRDDFLLVAVHLRGGTNSAGLEAELVSGFETEGEREVVIVTVEEVLFDNTYEIEYVLVFEKEKENGESAGHEDDGELGLGGEEVAPEPYEVPGQVGDGSGPSELDE